MTPCEDFLLDHIRQAEHFAVARHEVQEAVRLLRIGAADDLAAAYQMFCQKREVCAVVAVAFIRIPRITDDRAAPLHIDDAVADAQGRDAARTVVFLILRRDVRRLDGFRARDRPCVAIREDHEVVADVHVIDAVRLS